MFTVIFGRPGCPYCVRAKELAEKLTNERDDFNYPLRGYSCRRHQQS
ncbi:Glutaredoxin 1 [Klebsiella pneumoniae IS10]|nr:Glutaredoxin 1 [Klebsiella pneumoniae IS10]CDK71211.1 Glutaredoxin 1 [Klebsiella pneumoniae IS22]CDL51682.1 Glutaredoxin 1 [Klebsiella pneumoniae ISC21]